MWPVKNANFIKQENSHTTAFTLAHFCTKFDEEHLNIVPLNIAAGRTSKDQIKSPLMLSLHGNIVPLSSTNTNYALCWVNAQFKCE